MPLSGQGWPLFAFGWLSYNVRALANLPACPPELRLTHRSFSEGG